MPISLTQTLTYLPVFHLLLLFLSVFLSLGSHLQECIFHIFISPICTSPLSIYTFSYSSFLGKKILLMLCKVCRKEQKEKCRNGLSNYGMFYLGKGGFHHCLATVTGGNSQKPTAPLALIETQSRQHSQFKILENTGTTLLYNLCSFGCCLSPTSSKKKKVNSINVL